MSPKSQNERPPPCPGAAFWRWLERNSTCLPEVWTCLPLNFLAGSLAVIDGKPLPGYQRLQCLTFRSAAVGLPIWATYLGYLS